MSSRTHQIIIFLYSSPTLRYLKRGELRNEGGRSSVPIVCTAGRHWPAAVLNPSEGRGRLPERALPCYQRFGGLTFFENRVSKDTDRQRKEGRKERNQGVGSWVLRFYGYRGPVLTGRYCSEVVAPPLSRGPLPRITCGTRAWTLSQVIHPDARPPTVGYSLRSLGRACNLITPKGTEL